MRISSSSNLPQVLKPLRPRGWIVELASLSDPGLVPSTVASTLGLKLVGEISAGSVARAVGGSHLLLVLDNCEQVIEAVANLAETVTRLCQAKTLLTEALETADALNDPDTQARALSTLISIYGFRGEYGRARIAAERIEQIATRIDDLVNLRVAHRQIGLTLLTSGKPREAQQYFERILRSPAVSGGPPRRDLLQFE